jgi:hypothetical protein
LKIKERAQNFCLHFSTETLIYALFLT